MIGQTKIFTVALLAAVATALGCAPATSAERCCVGHIVAPAAQAPAFTHAAPGG